MHSRIRRVIGIVVSAAVVLAIAEGFAANARSAGDVPSACNLSGYKPLPGLTASATEDGATLVWDGDAGSELRLTLGVRAGAPSIRELAVRRRGAAWATVAAGVTPEFRVASGLRRLTNQQLDPLAGLDVPITPAVLEREKWEAFWDAPLNVPGGDAEHNDVTPPQHGVLDQPGLPRSPDEIKRATAIYQVNRCDVTTNGARIEVSFPGVTLGVFSGRLQFTVYRGTNLIRQEIIATTNEPSVAYKYDAGLKGLAISPSSRILWRGITNLWQDYHLGSAADDAPVTLKTSNRIVVAEGASGSIAAFPPPHTFFWARETSYNLGYDWYRKDDATTFSFGIRQAESEEPPEEEGRGTEDRHQNFALLSARPGTSQHMAMYLYVNPGDGPATMDAAWAFTRDDHFKAVPGFQVMATHFHMSLLSRARHFGGLDARVPDLEVLKAAGVTIVAPIDGGGGFVAGQSGGDPAYNGDDPKWLQWSRGLGAPPEYIVGSGVAPPPTGRGRAAGGAAGGAGRGGVDPYKAQADYFDVATRQSDSHFVVMPNSEMIRGDVTRDLGGHSDVFVSHRVFWTQGRKPGQPLVEDNPTYGRVYHVGTTADMMEMAHRENMLLFMPHPRTKGSAGFPDAIKTAPHFLDPNYRGAGFRWGMGLDGSETRLCEYRCLSLFDDMNNWVADVDTPPKYLQAISEMYQQGYGDDIYANNPVNYVKIVALPPPGEWTPIVDAMKTGAYFVTSGEVLIPNYAVRGSGSARTIIADVEWTFPLEFVEVVWGDGQKTGRQVIPATDLPPFGRHHFEIPFDATGKKWVRFAAWDSAGNGAFVMPIKTR